MATDDERREVARRLRELVPCLFDDGEYIDCGEVEEALGLVNDDGSWYKADGVMRLADLIDPEPELTCGLKYDSIADNYVCTCCGERFTFPMYDAEMPTMAELGSLDSMFKSVSHHMKFCPHCGAGVVDE